MLAGTADEMNTSSQTSADELDKLMRSSEEMNRNVEEITEAINMPAEDNVNHPAHYTQGGIECIDAIEASMSPEEFRGYLKGCQMKYLWRYRMKGGLEDLQKARWYLDKLISKVEVDR